MLVFDTVIRRLRLHNTPSPSRTRFSMGKRLAEPSAFSGFSALWEVLECFSPGVIEKPLDTYDGLVDGGRDGD